MSTTTLGAAGPRAPARERAVIDLDVRVRAGPDGLVVEVECDELDTHVEHPFAVPVQPDVLAAFADGLAVAQTRHLRARGRQHLDVLAQTETIGRALFDSVFTGDALRSLTQAQGLARSSDAFLRLRLRLDAVPDVARLPWELLRDDTRYLVHTSDEFVVRFADVTTNLDRVRRDGPLRVLVVASSPSDLRRLDIEGEVAALESALAPLGGDVVLGRVTPPTVDALRAALLEEWHVLHFIGHGDEGETGHVLAFDKPDGTWDEVDATTLATLLVAAPTLRLAVLNGCRTGEVPQHHPKNGVAQQLVMAGVPAAVAMQFPITDVNAVSFAGALYQRLAAGALVDQAVAYGRQALVRGPEWVTPVLYARSRARLFETPPPAVVPGGAPAAVTRVRDHVPHGVVPPAPRFEPRAWVAAEVAAWLDTTSPLLLLTGDHGTGKSVLTAWLAGQGEPPEDPALAATLERVRSAWSAVQVSAASLAGASTDPRAFVREVAAQLAATVPGWVAPPGDPVALGVLPVGDLFDVVLLSPLRAALRQAGGGPATILVDGLDEAGAGPEPTTLALVRRLAALDVPVRLLLAGPDDAELLGALADVEGVRRLDLSSPGRRAQVDDDVRGYLARQLAAVAVDADVVERVVEAAAGNFLYARHAADELAATPDAQVRDLVLPGDLDESFVRHVRRVLERQYGDPWRAQWTADVEPLLAQLAVALAPVPRAALEAWLGWDQARLGFLLDQLQQLVVADEQGVRLTHPSLGAMLRRATLTSGRANPLLVQEAAAHRRVVTTTLALDDAALARPDRGGTYGLVHAPAHLAELLARGPDDDPLLGTLTARLCTAGWTAALAASVPDAVLVAQPYRDLVRLLLARGDTARVEVLTRFLATTDVPVLRGAVFDVLTGYVAHDEAAAEHFLVALALEEDAELQAIALHATCLLSASHQASAFCAILAARPPGGAAAVVALRRLTGRPRAQDDDGGAGERASAAAFALYANGTADPQRLIRDVLVQMVDGISVTDPLRSLAVVNFFGQVTVTNYINGCSDPAVTRLTSDLWKHLLVERLHLGTLDRLHLDRVLVERGVVRELSLRIGRIFADDDVALGPGLPGADAASRVVRALDPAVDVVPHEADLRTLLASDVTLLRILAALTLGVHGVAHAETTAPLVRRLLDGADPRARRWLLLSHAVVLPGTPDAWVPLLEEVTTACTAGAHDDHTEAGPLHGLHLAHVPLGLAYAKAGLPMTLHERVLTDAPDDAARECCLRGLGAVGLYHPDAALATLGGLADRGVLTLTQALPALALVAGVHPLRTRAWLLGRGERRVLDEVWGSLDVAGSRAVLELLGMFTNGVHQSLHYPRMRQGLCATVFTHYLEAPTLDEWARRWTHDGMTMLRDAEYELVRWTT